MVREAVKQYAVDPDQFFGVSPDDPQYAKLERPCQDRRRDGENAWLQSRDQRR